MKKTHKPFHSLISSLRTRILISLQYFLHLLIQMLHSHIHHNHQFLFTNLPISLTTHHFSSPSPLHKFHHNSHSIYAINPSQEVFLPLLNKLTTAKVELSPIFDAIDDSSSNQVTISVVLSVAIAVFLFPTIQRRIKRAKQLVCFVVVYSDFF